MDEVHKDAIRKNLSKLATELTLEPLLTTLVSERVFTEYDHQYISAEKTDFDKNRKLCLDIRRKGPNAYAKFIELLTSTEQEHLAQSILLAEYNLRNETDLTEYHQIPSSERMEVEGCFSIKKKKKKSQSAKGCPVTQATEDSPDSTHIPEDGQRKTSPGGAGEPSHLAPYRMESNPRGYMRIFNNQSFKHMSARKGSQEDIRNLKETFERLGYNIIVHEDLTMQEMKDCLEDFSKLEGHKSVDSMIIAFLSHGSEGALCGIDSVCYEDKEPENVLPLKDVENIFNGRSCPLLIRKPKLFIVQACRGVNEDKGVWTSDAPVSDPDFKKKYQANWICTPTNADFIFAYATVADHYAYRNTVTGSPYIHTICEVFKLYSKEKHVMDMLTMVTNKVADMDMSNSGDVVYKKMLPQKTDTLRHFWYLNPLY